MSVILAVQLQEVFIKLKIVIIVDGFKLDKDPEVSGHHLTFKWSLDHDCLQVQDEKSFNGTALNLNIMKPKVFYSVRSGSTLHVGQSTFTILIKEKDEENSSKDKVNKNGTNDVFNV